MVTCLSSRSTAERVKLPEPRLQQSSGLLLGVSCSQATLLRVVSTFLALRLSSKWACPQIVTNVNLLLSFSAISFLTSFYSDIHRLGRTARAGNEGHGVLILTPEESFFTRSKKMKDLPLIITPVSSLVSEEQVAQWSARVNTALDGIDSATKGQAYQVGLCPPFS